MFSAVIQIARRILYPKWECFRQSSAWICISVKHIDHCAAHSLSAQVGFQLWQHTLEKASLVFYDQVPAK